VGDPAEKLDERIVVDGEELERLTAEVVREVPAHMVAAELRRRMAAHAEKKKKAENPVARERARRIAEGLVKK
jgi:hypothetical protein